MTPVSPFVSHACAIITIINRISKRNRTAQTATEKCVQSRSGYRISRFGTNVSHSSDFPFYRLRSNHDDDDDVMIQQQVRFSLRVARHMVKALGESGLGSRAERFISPAPSLLYRAIVSFFTLPIGVRIGEWTKSAGPCENVATVGNENRKFVFLILFYFAQILYYCGSAR